MGGNQLTISVYSRRTANRIVSQNEIILLFYQGQAREVTLP